ncbi:unnamed protein product [Candidula unifasciata]|uniref:Hexosyltransferase n=1 Tax=Candidula unifasciata TaxID=100452 RepID=A0A8S3YDY5_9EUPU|nr:unnamed protein product [Candidula unifasciata]
MASCSSATVSAKLLAVISLFVLLTVALQVKYTYFFGFYTILSAFGSNYSAQTNSSRGQNLNDGLYNKTNSTRAQIFDHNLQTETNSTRGNIFEHSLQNRTNGTTLFSPKLVSEHPFLLEEVINPHNFEYVIRPAVKCSGRDIELVIGVPITRDNHAGRSVIRRTWGSYANDTNNKAVLLFFVGSENNKTGTGNPSATESRLQEEASTFGDIVQENYIDSYRNLSLKSMSILKWVNKFCLNTKYILKVDDDMYVNIPFLMELLQEFVTKSSTPDAFIIGCLIPNSGPIRHKISKWYTSEALYKQDKYPNFVSGTAYAMTLKAAVLSYEASLRVPLFWLEDVFITGLCARKANIPVYKSKFFSNGKLAPSGCTFRSMATGHGYNVAEITKIHSELFDPHLKC